MKKLWQLLSETLEFQNNVYLCALKHKRRANHDTTHFECN